MRLLHTSDWHLGQHFMGKTRQAEHRAFLDWLAQTVRTHAVDAVIVAGDIFDTGAPPSYARELYHHCVLSLRDAGVQLVVLGGNHDSVATLSESRDLLACLSATVVPATGEVLLLRTRDGTPGALLCAVPFLRARDLVSSEAGQSAGDKQLALQQAIRAHYAGLHEAALLQRTALGLPDLPVVATGHLTTVGASASESVREIYVGALEAFPTQAFPPADYIALGHIHRPQKVGGLEHVRYSGSPLPLGFDEASQIKEVLLVDLPRAGQVTVTPLPVPRTQALHVVRGTLAAIGTQLADLAAAQAPGACAWLDVVVSGDDYLSDLQGRVAALCDGLPLEVLRLRRERQTLPGGGRVEAGETLDELVPAEVFARRLAAESLDEDLAAALRQRFDRVVAELAGEASA